MSKYKHHCTQTLRLNANMLTRYRKLGRANCALCGKTIKLGAEVVRSRSKRVSRIYHPACHRKTYILIE